MSELNELQAVAERYARRDASDRYSPLRPEVWQMLHERQRVMLTLLRERGRTDLASLRVTEVGCGSGGNLLELLRLGFAPEHLQGIELLPDRFVQARHSLPTAVRLLEGDASVAAIQPASQDIIAAFTVFSSLLDDAFQQKLADAMWQWLAPGGVLLWYDFTVDNPRNPDVRGVPLARVQALFPNGRITARRVTLAPPIARRVAPIHPSLYGLFNSLPFLRTHLFCWIEKP